MSKLSRQIRNLVFVLVVVILSFACTIELLQIQIVDGEYYKDQTANTYTANQTVQAARGQIFTKDGKVVNTNRLVYKIIVQKAFFKSGTENDVIAKTLKILQNNCGQIHPEKVQNISVNKVYNKQSNKKAARHQPYRRKPEQRAHRKIMHHPCKSRKDNTAQFFAEKRHSNSCRKRKIGLP